MRTMVSYWLWTSLLNILWMVCLGHVICGLIVLIYETGVRVRYKFVHWRSTLKSNEFMLSRIKTEHTNTNLLKRRVNGRDW